MTVQPRSRSLLIVTSSLRGSPQYGKYYRDSSSVEGTLSREQKPPFYVFLWLQGRRYTKGFMRLEAHLAVQILGLEVTSCIMVEREHSMHCDTIISTSYTRFRTNTKSTPYVASTIICIG